MEVTVKYWIEPDIVEIFDPETYDDVTAYDELTAVRLWLLVVEYDADTAYEDVTA